jgi:hypothetical protein
MNTPVLITVWVMALLFIIFLIIRNQKDKKEVVDQMKKDYPHREAGDAGDEDIDAESKI